MYLWAFTAPHPHRTAAEWLGPLVAADQVRMREWNPYDVGIAAPPLSLALFIMRRTRSMLCSTVRPATGTPPTSGCTAGAGRTAKWPSQHSRIT